MLMQAAVGGPFMPSYSPQTKTKTLQEIEAGRLPPDKKCNPPSEKAKERQKRRKKRRGY
jgi:hypothetical protein